MTLDRPGAVLACVLVAALSAVASGETRIADIHEGTNISIALSPDGRVLVTDLLGRLWRLPAAGGGAEPLTPEDEAARYPRFSPDGRYVAYQRLVGEQWDLWLLELETGERTALVESAFNERQPDFSVDGRSVVFSSDRSGHYCLWSVRVDSGVLTQLTEEPGDASFPTVSDFGEVAYVRRDGPTWSLRVLTAQGVGTELTSGQDELFAPSWRPGGGVLIYNEREPFRSSALELMLIGREPVVKPLTVGEDVFTGRVAWESPSEYLYTADGHIWRRGIAHVSRDAVPMFAAVTVDTREPPLDEVPLDAPGPNPVLGGAGRSVSEDGRTEVFAALGDLWLLRGRGSPRRLTDDAFVDIDPSVSPDGRFAVFASDRGGHLALWRVGLPDGTLAPLTSGAGKAYRPSVYSDGTRVAFLETTGFGPWGAAALRVLELSGRGAARTLAENLQAPSVPRWDPSAARISLEEGPAARRVRLEVDVASGRESFPAIASTAAPAEPHGSEAVTEPARSEAITEPARSEAAEPTESSRSPEAPDLQWRPPTAEAPYVVQVGRLFDGVRGDYLRHVDVHIEGQRIVAISPRNVLPLPDKVIDARDATVIPGLIDVHVHESSLMGERLGRIWLAHGVTTVRELTDDVPGALARAESWASGRRLGPRLIVSAEAGSGPALPAAPEPALPSPIPVQSYSALPAVYSLLQPGPSFGNALGSAARLRAPYASTERADDPAYRLRTSPLSQSYQDVLSTVVESQTVVTSTLAAALGPGAAPRAWRSAFDSPAFRTLYDDAERARWLGRTYAQEPAEALEANVARLVRAGGRVAAGSEAPAVPYGLGVHLELALLADAGIPLDQVLRIATAQNAMALGLESQLGTLEEGKLADLVVLDGNPLLNLADTSSIVAVVKGGVWLDRRRLLQGP
jgi:Tol biopolymer transport system component